LVAKNQEQLYATQSLIDRLFKGSASTFFSHFVNNQNLSKEDVEKIFKLLKDSED